MAAPSSFSADRSPPSTAPAPRRSGRLSSRTRPSAATFPGWTAAGAPRAASVARASTGLPARLLDLRQGEQRLHRQRVIPDSCERRELALPGSLASSESASWEESSERCGCHCAHAVSSAASRTVHAIATLTGFSRRRELHALARSHPPAARRYWTGAARRRRARLSPPPQRLLRSHPLHPRQRPSPRRRPSLAGARPSPASAPWLASAPWPASAPAAVASRPPASSDAVSRCRGPRPASQPAQRSATHASPGTYQVQSTSRMDAEHDDHAEHAQHADALGRVGQRRSRRQPKRHEARRRPRRRAPAPSSAG